MDYEQWKRILSAVNKEGDLSKDNVIEKIKEGLKAEDKDEYKKWEEAGFDVNHLFEADTDIIFRKREIFTTLDSNEDEDPDYKTTLLHLAVCINLKDIVNVLLKVEKINVNAVDNAGLIPLHLAAAMGNIDVVKALIEKGADVNAKDNGGRTPSRFASCDKIKELLAKAEKEQQNEDNLSQDKDDNKNIAATKTSSSTGLFAGFSEEEEKQQNEDNSDKDDETEHPLEETQFTSSTKKIAGSSTGHTEPTSAAKKGVFAGCATALLGTAAAVALFATGTVAVELIPIAIAVVAVTVAALAVGGITYTVLKPCTEVDKVKEEQGITGESIAV